MNIIEEAKRIYILANHASIDTGTYEEMHDTLCAAIPELCGCEMEYNVSCDAMRSMVAVINAHIGAARKMLEEVAEYQAVWIGRNQYMFAPACKMTVNISIDNDSMRYSIRMVNPIATSDMLNDAIRFHNYVIPRMNGDIKVWEKTRKCVHCGNFFPYDREITKFCSAPCRQRYNYLKRKSRGVENQYQNF